MIDVVLGRVDLRNHHALHVAEHHTELLVLGCEGLAVAAPRSIEFEQHVLAAGHHALLEVASYDHLHSRIVIGLGLSRLEVRLHDAVDERLLEAYERF
jgi:hypothetical protein